MKNVMLIIISLLLGVSTDSIAKLQWYKNDSIKSEEISTVKIVYNAEINAQRVADLILSLDEINNDYPSVQQIELYINSFGGSMDSGYVAMQAISGSKIPVKTINTGTVASSATLLYCGGKERKTFSLASFILHPAKSYNLKKDYLSPGEIDTLKKDVNITNQYFKNTYSTCTNINKEKLNAILSSEDSRQYVNAKEAESLSLSQGVESGIKTTQASYYITDDNT